MATSQGSSTENAGRLNGLFEQAIQALLAGEAEGERLGLDTGLSEIARTRFEVAFHVDGRRLREWLTVLLPGLVEVHRREVPPGALVNAVLASTPTDHLAALEAPLRTFFGEDSLSLFSHFLQQAAQQARRWPLGAWTAPVPLRATRPGRKLTTWLKRRGYRVDFNFLDPEKSRVVDGNGAAISVPKEWAHLVSHPQEATRCGSALVFAADTPQPLLYVEAAMVRMAGGKFLSCPSGHRYFWQGRKSKRWCPAHRREVEALEVRYRRLEKRLHRAPPEKQGALRRSLAGLKASLRKMGYRWGGTRRRP